LPCWSSEGDSAGYQSSPGTQYHEQVNARERKDAAGRDARDLASSAALFAEDSTVLIIGCGGRLDWRSQDQRDDHRRRSDDQFHACSHHAPPCLAGTHRTRLAAPERAQVTKYRTTPSDRYTQISRYVR
jgi:hypothetical protein